MADAPLLNTYTIERSLGEALAGRFVKPIDAVDGEIKKLESQLEAQRRTRRFLDRKARAAVDSLKSLSLAGVDDIQIYDEDLRAVLAKCKVETVKSNYNYRTYRHEKKPTGAAPWSELVKKGATDAQVRTNLVHLNTPYEDSQRPSLKSGEKPVFWPTGTPSYNTKKKDGVAGAELVAAVRRVLQIPLPDSTKAPSKPGANKKPAQAAKPAAAKKAPKAPAKKAKPKRSKQVKFMESPAAAAAPETEGHGGSPNESEDEAPERPAGKPAAAAAGFGDWARAVRKALKRKKFDTAVVKEESPWTEWHAQGKRPAAAAAAWMDGSSEGSAAGDEEAAGRGTAKPAAQEAATAPGDAPYIAHGLGIVERDVDAAYIADRVQYGRHPKKPPQVKPLKIDDRLWVVISTRSSLTKDDERRIEEATLDPLYAPAEFERMFGPTTGDVDGYCGIRVKVGRGEMIIGPASQRRKLDYSTPASAPAAGSPSTTDEQEEAARDAAEEPDLDVVWGTAAHTDRWYDRPVRRLLASGDLPANEVNRINALLASLKIVSIGDLWEAAGTLQWVREAEGLHQAEPSIPLEMAGTICRLVRHYFGTDQHLESVTAADAGTAAKADDGPQTTKPGEVYAPEDLDVTADAIRHAFAGDAIRRGDPARVAANPVVIDGYPFLYVGMVSGRDDDVARLVQLIAETPEAKAQLDKLRAEPRGAYCGRRVQIPNGTIYVVGPEDHNIMVRMPAAEPAAGNPKKKATA